MKIISQNFEKLNDLKWLPWIGKNYESYGTLVLGESHYEDGDEWQLGNTRTTIQITEKYLNQAPGNWKLHKNIEKVITNKASITIEEKLDLWNSITYWNLVQRLLDSRNQIDRPTDKDFDNGWKLFFDVYKIIKPRFCLVLGKSSYGRLGYFLNNSQEEWVKNDSLNYPNEKVFKLHNKNTLDNLTLVFINHPSGSFGFDYNYWHPILKTEFDY